MAQHSSNFLWILGDHVVFSKSLPANKNLTYGHVVMGKATPKMVKTNWVGETRVVYDELTSTK